MQLCFDHSGNFDENFDEGISSSADCSMPGIGDTKKSNEWVQPLSSFEVGGIVFLSLCAIFLVKLLFAAKIKAMMVEARK